jgi:hypothetical protein
MQYFSPNILLIFLSKSSSIFLPKSKILFSILVLILSFIKSGIVFVYISNKDNLDSNPFKIFITLVLFSLSIFLFSSSFSLVIEQKLSSLLFLFLKFILFARFFLIKFFFNFSFIGIKASGLS